MDTKKTAAEVIRMADEHAAMEKYIEMILPFLKAHAEARNCGADVDGAELLRRVRS